MAVIAKLEQIVLQQLAALKVFVYPLVLLQ